MQVRQDSHAFLVLLRINEPPRRLGQEQSSDREDGTDDGLHEERKAPGQVGGDVGAEVVEPLQR